MCFQGSSAVIGSANPSRGSVTVNEDKSGFGWRATGWGWRILGMAGGYRVGDAYVVTGSSRPYEAMTIGQNSEYCSQLPDRDGN